MTRHEYPFRVMPWIMAALVLWACAKDNPVQESGYLIKVGGTITTPFDFIQSFDHHRTARNPETRWTDASLKEARISFLHETIERMTLSERARELGITVSAGELKAAVDDIRKDYPENEFEKALLESSLSLETWQKTLEDRLLMEKVIQKELSNPVNAEQPPASPDQGVTSRETAVMQPIYNEKVEKTYPQWLTGLQQRYQVDINREKWREIAGN